MDETSTTDGEPVRQFSVFLPNRTGALLGIVKLVNDCLAEVLAVSVQDAVDGTVARMVVSDAEAVATSFIERGIPHSESEVLVVELGEASEFAPCLAKLWEGEVNVHFCYPLMSRPNGRPALVLYLDDLEFGDSLLSANGYRLLLQDDLSR